LFFYRLIGCPFRFVARLWRFQCCLAKRVLSGLGGSVFERARGHPDERVAPRFQWLKAQQQNQTENGEVSRGDEGEDLLETTIFAWATIVWHFLRLVRTG
jgi:hypothetical protein